MPHLVCVRCGAAAPLGPAFEGCLACAGEPRAALEVVYDYAALAAGGTAEGLGVARRRALAVPGALAAAAGRVDPEPGGGRNAPGSAAGVRCPSHLAEGRDAESPGSFKDRLHAVSLTMARALGFRKAVASTTGNHGTALAAYAARAGMTALVFCDPRAPLVQRRLMQLFGARVVVLAERAAHIGWLVRERGWYPSSGMTPEPVSTPYGVEGYKTIAYEIFFQLGGRFPGRMLVPTSGGDAVYGPWKGFRELPRSAPLARCRGWWRSRRPVATRSCGAGRRAPRPCRCIRTLGRSRCRSPTRPADRGRSGRSPSPAAPRRRVGCGDPGRHASPRAPGDRGRAIVGGVRGGGARAGGADALGAEEDVVCILTGAGAKWPEALVDALTPRELRDASPAAVRAWIDALDPEGKKGSG